MAGSSEPVGLNPTERAFLRALQAQGVPFMLVGIAAAAKEAGVVYVPGGIATNPP